MQSAAFSDKYRISTQTVTNTDSTMKTLTFTAPFTPYGFTVTHLPKATTTGANGLGARIYFIQWINGSFTYEMGVIGDDYNDRMKWSVWTDCLTLTHSNLKYTITVSSGAQFIYGQGNVSYYGNIGHYLVTVWG